MDDIDQWIPNLLRGKRVPADVVYNIRKNPSLLSPGITSRRRTQSLTVSPFTAVWPTGEHAVWPTIETVIFPDPNE